MKSKSDKPKKYQKKNIGAGEIAQQIVLPEDLASIPSTHMAVKLTSLQS